MYSSIKYPKRFLFAPLAAFAFSFAHNPVVAAVGSDANPDPLGSGFYAQLRGSANFLDDSANGANAPNTLGRNTSFDTGFGISGAIGRDLSRFLTGALTNFRGEFELAYAESGIENRFGNPEIRSTAYMANLYHDLQSADPHGKFIPYVGVGVGAVSVNCEGIGLTDDDDTVFAYQVRAGLGYRIRPDLRLSVGYRFFDAADADFRSATGRFDSEFRSHAVEAGLNYAF